MMTRTKYPRSFHLPWSEGATDDDKTLRSVEHFVGKEVVVTEKLDGENTTIYADGYMHARSVDGRSHPSQAWVRALAATVGHDIPKGWRIVGENVYAQHSLSYDGLSSYFYVFAIYDDNNTCLSWDDTVEWAALLGLETVPVLYHATWDEEAIRWGWENRLDPAGRVDSAFGTEAEGYVVRVASAFAYEAFSVSLAKFVRANHVDPNASHWAHTSITPNLLECGRPSRRGQEP